MLRSELARGLSSFLAAVDTSRALSVVESVYRDVSRETHETRTLDVVECFQKFMLACNTQFNDTERAIMRALDVSEFADSTWWTTLITASSPGGAHADAASIIGHPFYRLRFVVDYLPSVLALLKQGLPDTQADPAARLVIVLPEQDGRLSSPARVTEAFDAVVALYEAHAEIDHLPMSDLVLSACDSGADKIFEFTGLPELITKVRLQLLEIWRNAIYYREKQSAERIDLITRALPILAEIAQLERTMRIEPERAELLRRKISAGAAKFIESGSSIPEMTERSVYVPRQLLTPKETLLLAG